MIMELIFLNLDNYTGQQLHDSNYVGNKEWITIYTSLYSSQVRLVSSLPSPETVSANINSYNLPQSTGLAILHYNYIKEYGKISDRPAQSLNPLYAILLDTP